MKNLTIILAIFCSLTCGLAVGQIIPEFPISGQFAVLADGYINDNNPKIMHGFLGATGNISSTTDNGEITFPNNNNIVVEAIEEINIARSYFNALPGGSLGNSSLNGVSFGGGVYFFKNGVGFNNNDTITLVGDENSVFVFNISGDLGVGQNVFVKLDGNIRFSSIFWNVEGNIAISSGGRFRGVLMGNGIAVADNNHGGKVIYSLANVVIADNDNVLSYSTMSADDDKFAQGQPCTDLDLDLISLCQTELAENGNFENNTFDVKNGYANVDNDLVAVADYDDFNDCDGINPDNGNKEGGLQYLLGNTWPENKGYSKSIKDHTKDPGSEFMIGTTSCPPAIADISIWEQVVDLTQNNPASSQKVLFTAYLTSPIGYSPLGGGDDLQGFSTYLRVTDINSGNVVKETEPKEITYITNGDLGITWQQICAELDVNTGDDLEFSVMLKVNPDAQTDYTDLTDPKTRALFFGLDDVSVRFQEVDPPKPEFNELKPTCGDFQFQIENTTADPANNNPATHSWSITGGNAIITSGTTSNSVTVEALSSGNITVNVIVSNNNVCEDKENSLTFEAFLNPNDFSPTSNSNSFDPTSALCEGADLELYANTFESGITHLWEGPNNFTSTLKNPVIQNVSLDAAGEYSLTVSNGTCEITKMLDVLISPLGDAEFTHSTNLLINCEDGNTEFSGLNLNASHSWRFDFGGDPTHRNSFTSNVSNPVLPLTNGVYDITHETFLSTAPGCVDKKEETISISGTFDENSYNTAGTFTGAQAWTKNQNPIKTGTAIYIRGKLTVNADIEIKGMDFYFGSNGQVFVTSTADLTIDLSSRFNELPNCQFGWIGIRVNYLKNNSLESSVLIKGGSIISNAQVAASNVPLVFPTGTLPSSGGVIKLDGAFLVNNALGVQIHDLDQTPYTLNASSIKNSTFETNGNYHLKSKATCNYPSSQAGPRPAAMVELWDVRIAEMSGNTFNGNLLSHDLNSFGYGGVQCLSRSLNDNSPSRLADVAISAINSHIPFSNTNTIRGFSVGLVQGSTANSVIAKPPQEITGLNTEDCRFGVYLTGTQITKISGNVFSRKNANNSCNACNDNQVNGVYLAGAMNAKVLQNVFNDLSYGIDERNLSLNGSKGEVLKNEMNENYVGLYSFGDNSNFLLSCNNFTSDDMNSQFNWQVRGDMSDQGTDCEFPTDNLFQGDYVPKGGDIFSTNTEYTYYRYEKTQDTENPVGDVNPWFIDPVMSVANEENCAGIYLTFKQKCIGVVSNKTNSGGMSNSPISMHVEAEKINSLYKLTQQAGLQLMQAYIGELKDQAFGAKDSLIEFYELLNFSEAKMALALELIGQGELQEGLIAASAINGFSEKGATFKNYVKILEKSLTTKLTNNDILELELIASRNYEVSYNAQSLLYKLFGRMFYELPEQIDLSKYFQKQSGQQFISSNKEGLERLNLYPNPSSNGELNVELVNAQITDIKLTNTLGQVLIEEKIKEETSSIKRNWSWLESGIYQIKISSDTGNSYIRSIIISK